MSSGLIGQMHFKVFMTLPQFMDGGEAAAIYSITLPFSSYIHLLGIPKTQTQLFPSGAESILEPVELEGDYNKYFSLYAEKGMQEDSRYTLDPKAMAFTIDFCQAFSWEIVDNQLYIVQGQGKHQPEVADIPDTVVKFVNEIKPAIGRSLTDAELQALEPYDEEYRNDLKCPICQTLLKNESYYLYCPNGHGILIKGNALLRLHAGTLSIQKSLLKASPPLPKSIICPSCKHDMEAVSYNGSKTVIHTCSHCPYRWLDANNMI
jgi:hypothetical protein